MWQQLLEIRWQLKDRFEGGKLNSAKQCLAKINVRIDCSKKKKMANNDFKNQNLGGWFMVMIWVSCDTKSLSSEFKKMLLYIETFINELYQQPIYA